MAKQTRQRLAVYLDDDIKDWLEAQAAATRSAPSTQVAQLISMCASRGVSIPQAIGAVTALEGSTIPVAGSATAPLHGPVDATPLRAVAGSATAPLQPRPALHSSTKEKKKKMSPVDPEGFDNFWDEVPRKIGKGHAKKAYASALKKTLAESLLSGAKAWRKAVAGKDAQYVQHPKTWLNGEGWLDDHGPGLANEAPSLAELGLA